ncbi:hypothetical protein DL98DRAFT_514858 [Cadophora sp. DSE1049]|nr:hypothetical protein DL98DRAFT_514858 [Cadophora sp. DSE1049]
MAVQAAFDPSPAMVADMTSPALALGHPNLLPWNPNNMYLNNPQVMQPQPINNGFYSVDNYPPLSVGSATNPFDFGSPVLPTPVQAPRPPAFCTLCPASFTRYSDYQRHYESVHMGIKWHCFWPGCSNNRGNGYCRAEKLKTHQRRVHGLA